MNRFCRYKDALGTPGQGIHSYRIFNIPIVDVFGTLAGAYVVSKATGVQYGWSALFLFALGTFLHWLFCVQTPVTRFLGLQAPEIK